MILNEEYPLKHFYCTVDDEEFILIGDKQGLIYETLVKIKLGSIIVDIFENRDCFLNLLNNYKNKIEEQKYYKDDELLNQDIVLKCLYKLQEELEKITYYGIEDIPTDISNKYISLYTKVNIEKQKYINNVNQFNELEKVLYPEFEGNKRVLKEIKERNEEKKIQVDNMQNRSFKDFTIQQIESYQEEFELSILNILVYCQKKDNCEMIINKKKMTNKRDIVAYNYNFISEVREFTSYVKGICIKDGKLITDEELDKTSYENIRFINVFKFNNIIELLNLSFIATMNKKIPIHICKNCKKLFIPESRTDEIYCNRKSPQNPDKTCKQYGAKRTYKEQIKERPIDKAHIQTSQFLRMRCKRSKDEKQMEEYKMKLNKYLEEYKKKKEEYKSNKLEQKDFIKWIVSQKEGVKNGSTRNNKK